MLNLIALALLILLIQFGMGGGLYETLVIYPRWKRGVTPENLVQKLKDSGQGSANRGFWPFISPLQAMLAIVNLVLAWRYTGNAHAAWLTAALIIVVNRVITFSYFVPTMVRKFERPEKLDAAWLKKAVNRWTFLSPFRIVIEFLAWGTALYALVLLGR